MSINTCLNAFVCAPVHCAIKRKTMSMKMFIQWKFFATTRSEIVF